MKTPMTRIVTSDTAYLEDRIMRLNARLADARARRAASAAEYCDYLQSPGMTPCSPDDFSKMPTFTWTSWEWLGLRGDCDEPTPLVNQAFKALRILRRTTTR